MEDMMNLAATILNTNQMEVFKYVTAAVMELLPAVMLKKEEEAKKPKPRKYRSSRDSDERIKVTEDNVRDIMEFFKKAADARQRFVKAFPQFSTIRKNSTIGLKAVSSTIQSDRFNSNVAKIVGGGVGVVGGALAVSALVPAAAPFAVPLAAAGVAVGAAGGTVVLVSSSTEIVRLNSLMERAKEILLTDKEVFDRLMVWMDHCDKLAQAADRLMGFDITSKILNDVQNVVLYSLSLKQTSMTALADSPFARLVPLLVQHLAGLPVLDSVDLKLVMLGGCFLVSAAMFENENRFVFSSVLAVHRVLHGVIVFTNLGARVGTNALRMTGSVANVSTRTAYAIATGISAAVGIALDIVTIAMASIDIHNGSVSINAIEVDEVVEKLEEELSLLDKCYQECLQLNE